MNYIFKGLLYLVLICAVTAQAQLTVILSPPKVAGQKAVVELRMKNMFAESVQSARAICFLFDGQDKMVGESAKWVIGGTKSRPPLGSEKETSFNIVITSPRRFVTTNLTTKVSFSRLILKDGTSVNPSEGVTIERPLLSTRQNSDTNNPVRSKPLDAVIASASSPITIRPPSNAPKTVMVTNGLPSINSQQH
jgi:hypothetical protein